MRAYTHGELLKTLRRRNFVKRLIVIFLILAMVLCIASCGGTSDTPPEVCTSHADQNLDGKCDACGEAMPHTTHTDANSDGKCDECGIDTPLPELLLLEDGIATFKFVLASSVSYNSRQALNRHLDRLKGVGTTIKAVEDKTGNLSEYEILVGDVKTRGEEYYFDKHELGVEGYIIKRIGNKIIISAGSDEIMPYAIDAFFSEVLHFGEDETTLPELVIYEKDVVKIQDNYSISSVKVLDNDLKGYVIYAEPGSAERRRAADTLQETLYVNTGYYLKIVDSLEGVDKYIKFGVKERVKGDKGLSITVDTDGNLNILCAYDSKLEKAIDDFLIHNIKLASGEVVFGADYLYEYEVSVITYEEYGAKGDGETNDTSAIKQAHRAANEGGQTVVAREGAHYLINPNTTSITIRTDTIWTGAEFTIDSRSLSRQGEPLFYIPSSYSNITLSGEDIKTIFPDGVIDKDNLNFNWPYDFPAMVIPYNSNHKNYIRSSHSGSGTDQMELMYVDENGVPSSETPFLFDYTEITSVLIIRTDDTPITIEGGKFQTLSSCVSVTSGGLYISKGLTIFRSNVTVKGVKHYVTEPPKDGKMYPASSGFFSTFDSHNVTFVDCVMTGRVKYYDGTYDIKVSRSNQVLFKNCTQSNFYVENDLGEKVPSMDGDVYWGVMESGHCKNITFDTCTLSRFDAHAGLYNGKIINSTINAVEIIGGGTMLIENTHFVLSKGHLIDLRTDYGSTWRGDIIIRNCNVTSYSPKSSSILRATWMNRSFGYTTYMPNLVIDGLKYDNVEGPIRIINLTTKYYGVEYRDDNIHKDKLLSGAENKNPYQPLSSVTVLNNGEGYEFILYDIPIFENVILEGVNKVSAE